ncbi:glycosyltransferase family 4 protein [Pseudomonas fluorescens]|uniref:MraY family glycosyltransferase n=1 Tax=Pseudomonas fluorescens TaxID=294 RepID=UPI0035258D7D
MISVIIAIFLLSLVLTGVLRRYALSRSIIDIPNSRSSHTLPTPRGGGVAIVLSFLLALLVGPFTQLVDLSPIIAIVGSGALIAVIGFIDDHGHIPARWRLLGHFLAAAWSMYWLQGLPPIDILGLSINLHWFGYILGAVFLVWMLNLYNFMDGIDGLAGAEAVQVCLGACLLYICSDYEGLVWQPLMLASAAFGFLVWNLPPAKIFMGDAGSGFLGIVLGILAIQAGWSHPNLLWAWLILLGVFIVDASFTLVRRLIRGEKVYEAHRSHAYQFASRLVGRHAPVTLTVSVINLAWLLPWAWFVVAFDLDGFLGLVIAYTPLFLLAVKFRAGQKEDF